MILEKKVGTVGVDIDDDDGDVGDVDAVWVGDIHIWRC